MKAGSVPIVFLWSVKPVKRTTRVSLLAGLAELGALNQKRKKFVGEPNEQYSQSDAGLDQLSDSHNSGGTQAAKLETNPDPFSMPSLLPLNRLIQIEESHTWKLQFHNFAMSWKMK